MRLEHLTNRSATTLHREIQLALNSVGQFSIATAFINSQAIDLIETTLQKNKFLKSGRILIGMYNYFNKRTDLERLLQLTQNYPDKLQVHISLDQCFHWKYYYFNKGRQQLFYIGSANFTSSGMANNRELVVKLTEISAKLPNALTNLTMSFEKEWNNSRALAEFPLEDYEEAKNGPSSINKTQAILDFFSKKAEKLSLVVDNGKLYAISLSLDVKPATKHAIDNQHGDWDKDNWFVLSTKREFNTCLAQNFLLVFLKEGRNKVACCYSVIEDNDPNMKTSDGNYFIAYRIIKRLKLKQEVLEILRGNIYNIDLKGWKNPFSCKILPKSQAISIMQLLGFKK